MILGSFPLNQIANQLVETQLNQSPDPKSRADVAPSTDGLDKATNNISSSESPTESEPQKLSQRVVDIMTEVQTRQKDDQWEEALNEMNALFTKFDSLSPFEQATLLNFYTNTLIQLEMWQETISAFSLLITIPELPQGVHARALQALGQLSSQVEDYVMAKRYYEEWLEFTEGDESLATRRAAVQDLLDELNER